MRACVRAAGGRAGGFGQFKVNRSQAMFTFPRSLNSIVTSNAEGELFCEIDGWVLGACRLEVVFGGAVRGAVKGAGACLRDGRQLVFLDDMSQSCRCRKLVCTPFHASPQSGSKGIYLLEGQ